MDIPTVSLILSSTFKPKIKFLQVNKLVASIMMAKHVMSPKSNKN